MAKCSGCSGTCNCHISPTGTNVTVTGDGSVATPWVVNASGGGGGGRAPFYTVSTLGIAPGFGTPAPFAGTADFNGDGVNDQVAIQNAINASYAAGTTVKPSIYLMAGGYAINGPINTKGIHIWSNRGPGDASLVKTAGGRLFDNSLGGTFGLIDIEGFNILDFTGGGALCYISGQPGISIMMRGMNITGATSGADAAILQSSATGSADNGWIDIENCNATGGASLLIYSQSQASIRNNILAAGILMFNGSFSVIAGNSITGFGDGIKHTGFCDTALVTGNLVNFMTGNGIVLDGAGGGGNHIIHTRVSNNLVQNFQVGGGNTLDGILLQNNADQNTITDNSVFAAANGRYNINIATADCDLNFVTNNHLHDFATGAWNDAGTGTMTTAGNYL